MANNKFLSLVYKYGVYTENGAFSFPTSGDVLLDYFIECGTYRDREMWETNDDLSVMWTESPELTVKVIFYGRLISRKISGKFNTEKVQKGQGNRSEFRNALCWLAEKHPAVFEKNLWLVPLVGSWKDLWHDELLLELKYAPIYKLIQEGLKDKEQSALIAKYLPRIRSKSNILNGRHERLNNFVYGLLKVLKWSPSQYRKFKSSGIAHRFQQQMSRNEWDQLNFKEIPGKALFQLVNNPNLKGLTALKRHDQEERFLDWIKAQPTAKFTGYVYELLEQAKLPKIGLAQKWTLNKQFDGLIQLAKQDTTVRENVWCALDTSESMSAQVANTTAFDICIGLGIYFSELNEGAFHNHVIMFDYESSVLELEGEFTDKVAQIVNSNIAWGNTDFQSVIDEIVRMRIQNPAVPLTDYPTTLLVVSDLQFDPAENNTQTNYQVAMQKLKAVGLPDIKIIWWQVTGRTNDFPNKMDDEGVIMLGGFDGAILSMLLNEEEVEGEGQEQKPKTRINPYEAMLKALDQEILQQIVIPQLV